MAKSNKNRAEQLTMDLPGVAPKRGRRASGKALSNAERQRRWLKKRAMVPVGDQISATIRRLADQFEMTHVEVTRELLRFALCNKNWSQLGFPSRFSDK